MNCAYYTDSFQSPHLNIDGSSLLMIAFLILLIQASLITLVFKSSIRLGFEPEDTVCMIYSATHKVSTLINNENVSAFFKFQSETLNFHPLTFNQLANGFVRRSLRFSFIKKIGSRHPTHLLHIFPFFLASTFWCWCQPAREFLKGLKIGMGRFLSMRSLFFSINIPHTLS